MKASAPYFTGRQAMRDIITFVRANVEEVGYDKVAKSMGWSEGTLKRYLKQDDPNITILTLARLADAVGMELDVRFK